MQLPYNNVREEGCLPLRYSICEYLRSCGKVRQCEANCCENRIAEGERRVMRIATVWRARAAN